MDGNHLAGWRLHNLGLSPARFERPEQVVGWLGAVQSQDYGPAKWSLGARSLGVGDAAVERAFADGAILRTHVLRPTWHFVLPEDIRWLLRLTARRVHTLNSYQYRQLGLDGAVLERSADLLAGALRGGNRLTRGQLKEVLEGAGVATGGFRLAYFLINAELEGIVCSGGLRGRQHTYALLDERAPQARDLGHDEALAELTLRYFTSHGPATAKDFRWWSSLTAAEVDQGLEVVSPRLAQEVVDGVRYWFAPAAPPAAAPSPTVHLLQAYDEYLVGYSQSKYLLDASGTARALTRDRPVFNHVVVLDTQVAGHWKRTVRKDSVEIEAALYEPFDRAQARALQAAADRHGEFLGLTATVRTRGV
ncbi:MAG TPA: winged helix DNA-binding domain-containing protein [Actinomycetota bacterium]|jgi:hypothetical protein